GQGVEDVDPEEMQEWLQSLDDAVEARGTSRAQALLAAVLERARDHGIHVPGALTTDYVNTIPPQQEPELPGDQDIERRILAAVRWNAAIMVARANRPEIGVGGHIATYASAATLYEVGFNHFFRGRTKDGAGAQVARQGHASARMYARAYREGRLSEQQPDGFRQERSNEGGGLASYPHPRLMPDLWQFPGVTMGLSASNAIYHARFNRYL